MCTYRKLQDLLVDTISHQNHQDSGNGHHKSPSLEHKPSCRCTRSHLMCMKKHVNSGNRETEQRDRNISKSSYFVTMIVVSLNSDSNALLCGKTAPILTRVFTLEHTGIFIISIKTVSPSITQLILRDTKWWTRTDNWWCDACWHKRLSRRIYCCCIERLWNMKHCLTLFYCHCLTNTSYQASLNCRIYVARWATTWSKDLPQPSSSEPSRQSLSPSQRNFLGMQRLPSAQWYSQLFLLPLQFSSSDWSRHCGFPSHIWAAGMHILPWEHWNSPEIGEKNEHFGELTQCRN